MRLIAWGPAFAVHQQSDPSTFVPKGQVTNEIQIKNFTVKTYRSQDGDGSLEILCDGKRAYGQHGECFYVGDDTPYDESLRVPELGADITASGSPNLVVYEWTGGVHCCYVAYVFELVSSIRMLARIDGKHSEPEFVDFDGDALPEVVLYDWSFEYWPGSFLYSPAPCVILRWSDGQYLPDARLMETTAPSTNLLSEMADTVRNDDAWNDRVFNSGEYSRWYIPQQLFQTALDLMYGGHEELGRQFIKLAWTPKYPIDKELLAEFDSLLLKSPYWMAVKGQRTSTERHR